MAKAKTKTEDKELPASTAVTVTWSGGSRVYSKEVHGKDFADLAAEFATKHKGTVV